MGGKRRPNQFKKSVSYDREEKARFFVNGNGEQTYEDILWVLGLDGSNDSGGNHELLPGFLQVEVVHSVSGALVNVRFHALGAVLSSDMALLNKNKT